MPMTTLAESAWKLREDWVFIKAKTCKSFWIFLVLYFTTDLHLLNLKLSYILLILSFDLYRVFELLIINEGD